MGWKCAPQVLGLVRGEPKPGQKHRANGLAIAKEAGYERATKSSTFDRDRSSLNNYVGYKSGKVFWEELAEAADHYRAKVRTKTKDGQEVVRERKLRDDAVIGFSIIYNPPAEICAAWSDEDYEKFYSDCESAMEEIEPRLFRRSNIKMKAEHYDEGIPPSDDSSTEQIDRHIHMLGECVDEYGNYCGNLIDARLMDKINRMFPALMRERGWKEMDDIDVTDWAKAKVDEEYRKERNAKRRKSGRSVNSHIAGKLNEKIKEADAAIESAEELKASAQQIVSDAETQAESVIWDANNKAEKKRLAAEAEYEQIVQQADELIELRNQEADAEIRDKNREAAAEIEKRQQEADAEIKKKKKDHSDAAQAYIKMLARELAHLCERTGTDHKQKFTNSGGTMKEYQDAIEVEFQVLEDSLDAQAKVKAEMEIADIRSELQESRTAYDDAKKELEKLISETQPVSKTDMQFVCEVMQVVSTTRNQKVHDAASAMVRLIQGNPDAIADAYNRKKEHEAELVRQRIKESEARLVEVTGSGQPDEHNHGRRLPDIDFS